MASAEDVVAFLGGLEADELEIWRSLIVQMRESKIKENEADLISLSSTSMRVSPANSPQRPIDISQWKAMPSPKRGDVRIKRLPSFDEFHTTTSESIDFNDVGPEHCSGVFSNCHLGSVWFLRITGLYHPDELYRRTDAQRHLICQSSVCVEAIQRNEGTVVLKVLDLPARVQLTSTRTLYCLKKTMFDTSVVQEHFSSNTIKALRTSLKISDFDRFQLLLSVIRESSCYVSEIKWIRMQRDGGGGSKNADVSDTSGVVEEGEPDSGRVEKCGSNDSVESTDTSTVLTGGGKKCSGLLCRFKTK